MSTTNFLGVYFDPATNLWICRPTINRETVFLGRYKTAEQAALIRDSEVMLQAPPCMREKMTLNFPSERQRWVAGNRCIVELPRKLIETFEKRLIQVESGCHECKSSTIRFVRQYPARKLMEYTPRNVAWCIAYGHMLNEGPYATCGNPKCANVDHLFCPVTNLKALHEWKQQRSKRQSKLTDRQRKTIKASTESLAVLAKRYGVSRSTISGIKNDK